MCRLVTMALLGLCCCGCQIIAPSSQRAEEICLGPPVHLANKLPGMPEFVPVGRETVANDSPSNPAPHSKFHPVPTRPVFTPWQLAGPVKQKGMENPLMHQRFSQPAARGLMAEPIEAPGGMEDLLPAGKLKDGMPANGMPNEPAAGGLNPDAGGARPRPVGGNGRAASLESSRNRTTQDGSRVASRRRSRWADIQIVEDPQ